MPRQIALLICCSFVFCLLRYDAKKSIKVSSALWLPTIWMLCIATRSADFWLDCWGIHLGSAADPIFHASLLCVGVIILLKRNLPWSQAARQNGWLLALLGFMLISVAWSDTPLNLFKQWAKELTAVIMAFLVLSEAMPAQALEAVLRRTVYILIPFSVLFVKYYQDIGVIYSRWTGGVQWVGVTVQKNGLGRLCLISAFFLIWTFVRRWKRTDFAVGKHHTKAEIALFLMTVWLFRGPSEWAASATAIYALSVGLVTFFGLSWIRKHGIPPSPNMCVVAIACIVAFGIFTPLVGGWTVTAFTAAVGRNATLTGRTEIWASLLPDVSHSPIFGYGFNSFWTFDRIVRHDIGEAHNGYLEVWLGLGLVGVLITTMFLLSSARKVGTLLLYDYDWGTLTVCLLVMAAVHNISESSFDSFTRQLMAVVLFSSVSAAAATENRPVYNFIAQAEYQHG
jgi:exopolysaccharide production protein ExoQ